MRLQLEVTILLETSVEEIFRWGLYLRVGVGFFSGGGMCFRVLMLFDLALRFTEDGLVGTLRTDWLLPLTTLFLKFTRSVLPNVFCTSEFLREALVP